MTQLVSFYVYVSLCLYEFSCVYAYLQLQKEKRLLAHLFAGIADVLDAPGAIDAIASLSKKIADVICERNLQMETSMSLLSLLEKLSAWSVAIIKTNVLKGSLELKAIEMKVGKIPNFIDVRKNSHTHVHSTSYKLIFLALQSD